MNTWKNFPFVCHSRKLSWHCKIWVTFPYSPRHPYTSLLSQLDTLDHPLFIFNKHLNSFCVCLDTLLCASSSKLLIWDTLSCSSLKYPYYVSLMWSFSSRQSYSSFTHLSWYLRMRLRYQYLCSHIASQDFLKFSILLCPVFDINYYKINSF